MRRIVTLAAMITVFITLSAVQPGDAAPVDKTGLDVLCQCKGCHYYPPNSSGHSQCFFPDGTVLDCNSNTGKCQSLLVRNEHLLDSLINKNVNTILDDQQTVLKKLGDVLTGLGNLETKLGDVQTACAPPDLVPVALPGSIPPNVFCQVDNNGNLVVRVKNQGLTNAAASTLRITFSTPTGPMPVDVPTPALAGGGGFVDLATSVPANCYLSADRGCHFQIAVDVTDVVVEGDETNNNVSGVCSPVL